MNISMSRRMCALVIAGLAGSATLAVAGGPALAAGTGYVRLAHLSPDTPAVDVYLSSPSGAIDEQRFNGVGYGVVSAYSRLPTGSYAVAMRTAGSAPSTPPVLTTRVSVDAGRAYTVAGVGRFADLGLRVIEDDLALPPAGKTKVRVVQASVRAPVLGVSTTGGQEIASGVAFATTTAYQVINPGRWTLNLAPAGGGQASTVEAECAAGNVYSLIVLDAAGGGLKAELRVDARRQGGVPVGGVETGGGGTAPRGGPHPAVLGAAILALLGTGGLLAVRARRRPWTR